MSSEHLKKMMDVQVQARRFSSEVQDYVKGLADWTNEMKAVEERAKKKPPPVKNSKPKDASGDKLERIPIWDAEDWEAGRGPLSQ